MYKIQYNAIVDLFREDAKKLRSVDAAPWVVRYMDNTVDMLTEPLPGDADEMIERTEEVQFFARQTMFRMRQMYAVTGDDEYRDRAETLYGICLVLWAGREIALSLIGVEEL